MSNFLARSAFRFWPFGDLLTCNLNPSENRLMWSRKILSVAYCDQMSYCHMYYVLYLKNVKSQCEHIKWLSKIIEYIFFIFSFQSADGHGLRGVQGDGLGVPIRIVRIAFRIRKPTSGERRIP